MLIFNETINIFIKKQKERLEQIKKYYKLEHYSISNIYISDTDKFLGEYHYDRNSIILNKKLIMMKQETIDHILKHEFAHHCSMKKYGKNIESHGKEFKFFCNILDIIPNAKINIDKMDSLNKSSIKEEEILIKVKKLFSLSESSNENEAKLALAKANDLLLKHNLKYINKDYSDIYQIIIYEGKQINHKWRMISYLLKELFDVYPVFSYQNRNGMHVELNGTKENLEIASYISCFLDKELDSFFEKAKKRENLKGRSAKINYFNSLIMHYVDSIKENQNKNLFNKKTESLIINKNTLIEKKENFFKHIKNIVYDKKLKNSYSRYQSNEKASNAGKKDSKNLSIRKGMKGNNQKLLN